jgi:hypothetical protein
MFVSVYCLNKCTIKIKNQVVLLNDIADDMLGLGRLFADDTSIGHTAHDENTLKNMINIDLKYIQIWSKPFDIYYLSNFSTNTIILPLHHIFPALK